MRLHRQITQVAADICGHWVRVRCAINKLGMVSGVHKPVGCRLVAPSANRHCCNSPFLLAAERTTCSQLHRPAPYELRHRGQPLCHSRARRRGRRSRACRRSSHTPIELGEAASLHRPWRERLHCGWSSASLHPPHRRTRSSPSTLSGLTARTHVSSSPCLSVHGSSPALQARPQAREHRAQPGVVQRTPAPHHTSFTCACAAAGGAAAGAQLRTCT
eukprot:COSAG02_NODE_8440_length_2569_cov_2.127530_1_plen_217_part_00